MISIIIPAFNEQEAIYQTVKNLRELIEKMNIEGVEILVVDDGSCDETRSLAVKAGATVIHHPHNLGYGRALKTGINNATNDTIVITDADGTYPIEQIPVMLSRYKEGFDMVVGARSGEYYRGSAIKWPMRILLRFLVEWTTGRSIPDINSGLRVFSKSTIRKYFVQLCDTFSFTTSVTLAYMMNSRFVHYESIDYAPRIGNSHVRLWRDSMRTLQYIVQAILYYNPIKFFLLMSICCLAGALISVLIGIAFQMATGFIMGVSCIVAAIIVFSLGLIADLLRQILAK